jgi:nucleoside-diphosphate-sugar epimerase
MPRLPCSLMGAAVKTAGVRRLLFLGSSCIYPRLEPQPIQEEALLTGPLEQLGGAQPLLADKDAAAPTLAEAVAAGEVFA